MKHEERKEVLGEEEEKQKEEGRGEGGKESKR
jgi:hypothetical protein